MVTHLFQPFSGNGRQLRVAAVHQSAEQGDMPDVDKELAGDSVGKIAVWLLHQQQVAEPALIAAKSQRIFVAATVKLGGIA